MYEAFLIWQRIKIRQLPLNFSIKAQLHFYPSAQCNNQFSAATIGIRDVCLLLLSFLAQMGHYHCRIQ